MQVVPGFHMGEHTRGGRVYLVEDGLTCVLIDTGAPDGTLGAGELLASAGRKPFEVRLVLLTHAHRGHAGNAAGLRELTGAPLGASAAVARSLAGSDPGWRALLGGAWPGAPVRVDRTIAPGEVLDIVAGGIEVIDAPGHAGGSVAYHLPGPGVLCVGDAASIDRRGRLTPPRGPCADGGAARATAERLAAVDVRVVAPGHGVPAVDGRVPVRTGR